MLHGMLINATTRAAATYPVESGEEELNAVHEERLRGSIVFVVQVRLPHDRRDGTVKSTHGRKEPSCQGTVEMALSGQGTLSSQGAEGRKEGRKPRNRRKKSTRTATASGPI